MGAFHLHPNRVSCQVGKTCPQKANDHYDACKDGGNERGGYTGPNTSGCQIIPVGLQNYQHISINGFTLARGDDSYEALYWIANTERPGLGATNINVALGYRPASGVENWNLFSLPPGVICNPPPSQGNEIFAIQFTCAGKPKGQ
ncbi:hypothetical protein ACJBU6_04367 [Exserohilum turcicum]